MPSKDFGNHSLPLGENRLLFDEERYSSIVELRADLDGK